MKILKFIAASISLCVFSFMSAEETKIPASHHEIDYMGRIQADELTAYLTNLIAQ